jgi:molecular chaperone GrpE
VPKDKLTESEENKDLFELYSGLRMTENILMNTLKKHGLERFDPLEAADGQPQKFDPKLHEATFMAPSPDKNDGDVMFTQSKGYTLNGRVLRVHIGFPFDHDSCECLSN